MGETSKKGLLLVISGSAGTGKGTVIAMLRQHMADAFAYSVSATTRAPRPGEEDGVQYHFLTREAFEEALAKGEMLEHTEYCGNYYGTPREELSKLQDGRHLILEIEVEGARNVKRLYPEAVTVFIAPPDLCVLEARLRGRGTNTEEDIGNRMRTARAEMRMIPDYDYVVVNRDGEAGKAAEEICGILLAEQRKTARSKELIAALTNE